MKRFALALTILKAASANPFPQGVLEAIAPKDAIPSGCGGTWNGQPFGIAVERPAAARMAVSYDPMSATHVAGAAAGMAITASASMPTSMVMDPLTGASMPASMSMKMIAKLPEVKLPAGDPRHGGGAAAVAGAGARKGTDSTVTIHSTRTQVRTLTLRPAVPSSNPKPAGGAALEAPAAGAGRVVRLAVITQIKDGQVQAPPSPSPVVIPPVAKPTPRPTTSALIVTQIKDGQIQAPVPSSVYSSIPVVAGVTPLPPVVPVPVPVQAPAQAPAPAPAPVVPAMGDGMGSHSGIDMPGMAGMKRQINDSPKNVEFGLACKKPGADLLTLTLKGGILKDNKGRTGYIASNRQFQFDDPPQAGSIFTAGFSLCSDGYLALGGSKEWWQCRSGDFFNLYDKWIAAQCEPIKIRVLNMTEAAC